MKDGNDANNKLTRKKGVRCDEGNLVVCVSLSATLNDCFAYPACHIDPACNP